MRIIIVISELPVNINGVKGGVHSATINLLKGFASFDCNILVLSFNRKIDREVSVSLSDNVQIKFFPLSDFYSYALNYFFKSSKIVKKYVKDFSPDILHFQLGGALLLIRLWIKKKVTTVQTIHGILFNEAKLKLALKDKFIWFFNGVVEQILLPQNVIHISKYSYRLFSKKTTKNFVIIPNAVSEPYFEQRPKEHTTNHLLYVGVIDNRKNLILLLEALKILTAKNKLYQLNVIGGFTDQAYQEKIEKFVQENNLMPFVTFHGWAAQDTVREFINKCDILILPSKQETLPMVIAECMAAGKVVVASSVGGIPEMINNQYDGFLFNVFDSKELIAILDQLYDNNEKITAVSQMAKETGKKYHAKNVAGQTLDFYNKVLMN